MAMSTVKNENVNVNEVNEEMIQKNQENLNTEVSAEVAEPKPKKFLGMIKKIAKPVGIGLASAGALVGAFFVGNAVGKHSAEKPAEVPDTTEDSDVEIIEF